MRKHHAIISPQRNGETMRLLKFLVVSTLALLFGAGSALADDPTVIFDPMAVPITMGTLTYYDITQVGVEYTGLTWLDSNCAFATSRGLSQFDGAAGCMYFVNDTGMPVSDLLFTFNVDSAAAGSLNCIYVDNTLDSPNCPSTIPAGMVTLEFNGGNPIPPSTPTTLELFIIGFGGVSQSDFSPEGVQVPTHDPSTLILLASGIGLLGLCAVRRCA